MNIWRRSAPFLALFFILALFLAFQVLSRQQSQDPIQPDGERPQELRVFFTAPDNPESATLRGGPDARLASAIESAQFSVDMAIYKLDLWSIRDALIDAHRRGVEVRVVVESDYADEPEIQRLIERGIPVRQDGRAALMHHKFTVIDQYETWTGSMNYSVNGAYRHDNNLLKLRSAKVAANFTREFEEMFLDARYGALSRADTPYLGSYVDDRWVEVYFSPDDGVVDHLIGWIDAAQSRIQVLAFSFTHDALGEALLRANARGVDIQIVIERDQAGNTGSEVDLLLDAGIDLRLDQNPNSMHHKVILIDGHTIITGSYNFSRSAEEFNDENVIVVQSPALGEEYLVEFSRIYDQAGEDSPRRDG